MYGIDSWDLSQEEIREYREEIEYRNKLLQLDYSLRNLSILKDFKEANERDYQENWLNNSDFQNDLRKWRGTKNQSNNNKAFNTNDTNLFETIRAVIAGQWRGTKNQQNNNKAFNTNLFEDIRAVIANQLNIDVSQVTLRTEFVKDLGADSLDVVELIMALEEKFGIEIPDEQAEKIVNVGDVMRYIEKQLI